MALPRKPRTLPAEDRRQAILDAAADVFIAEGYAAARLDEVARRAGIAKGTIYLHFRDKQDLFQQLLQNLVGPMLDQIEALGAREDIPSPDLLRQMLGRMRTELLGTRRKDILRLVIAEGPRFPEIARFHHEHVVSRGIAVLRRVLVRAAERGEIASDAYARFPQLLVAPVLVGVIWDSLFGGFDPLDVDGLLDAHLGLVLGQAGKAT
jgi:AcrR family transcriptional regulator